MLAEPTQRLHPDLAGLQETFSLQREAAAREPYPDAATRDRRLAALERLLRTNVDAIAGAIARDFGHRSHHETRLLEIFPSLEAAKHAAPAPAALDEARAARRLALVPARRARGSSPSRSASSASSCRGTTRSTSPSVRSSPRSRPATA